MQTKMYAGLRPADKVDLWFDTDRVYLFDRETVGDLAAAVSEKARKSRTRFDREAPFGYGLVLPAVLYLLVFITYPFLMSIYMSFTDAQAGNRNWTWIGRRTTPRWTATSCRPTTSPWPHRDEGRGLGVHQRKHTKSAVDRPCEGRAVPRLDPRGPEENPLIEMATADDASFNAGSILEDLKWKIRKTIGGKYEVVAHSDTPLVLGTFPTPAAVKTAERQILVNAASHIKANGTGVLQDPNFLLAVKNTFKYTFCTGRQDVHRGSVRLAAQPRLPRPEAPARSGRDPVGRSHRHQRPGLALDSRLHVQRHQLDARSLAHRDSLEHHQFSRGQGLGDVLRVVLVNVWRGFPFTAIVILAGVNAGDP